MEVQKDGCSSKNLEAHPDRSCHASKKKICQACGNKFIAPCNGASSCESCIIIFHRNAQETVQKESFQEKQMCTGDVCKSSSLKKCEVIIMKAAHKRVEEIKKTQMEGIPEAARDTNQAELMEKAKEFHHSLNAKPTSSTSQIPQVSHSSQASSFFSTSTAKKSSFSGDSSVPENSGSGSSGSDVFSEQLMGVGENTSENFVMYSKFCAQHWSAVSSPASMESDKRSKVSSYLGLETSNDSGIGVESYDRNKELSRHGEGTNDELAFSVSNKPVVQKKPCTIDVTKLSTDQLPSDPLMYRRLTEDQRYQLTALSVSYEDTLLAILRNNPNPRTLNTDNFNVQDIVDECDILVRSAVSFVKKLDDFRALHMDDQIACFKSSLGYVMSVRNSFTFIPERNSWLLMSGEMPIELARKIRPTNIYADSNLKLCKELKLMAQNDVTLYALLHCILLFCPSGERVCNRQQISMMRNKYLELFRQYLEATFSYLYSEDYASLFQSKIVEIRDLFHANKEVTDGMKKNGYPFELAQLLEQMDSS